MQFHFWEDHKQDGHGTVRKLRITEYGYKGPDARRLKREKTLIYVPTNARGQKWPLKFSDGPMKARFRKSRSGRGIVVMLSREPPWFPYSFPQGKERVTGVLMSVENYEAAFAKEALAEGGEAR